MIMDKSYVNNSFALKCTCGNGNRIKSFNHLTFNVNVNRMLNCFECNVWVTTCHKRYFSKHVSILILSYPGVCFNNNVVASK